MLTSKQIRELCESLPGTTYELKEEWGSELGRVEGKIFAMYGEDNHHNRILTLKVEPLEGDRLKAVYPEWIKEGYYMNKNHWVSIHLDQKTEDLLVHTLIQQSYQRVVQSLPKKVRENLSA